MEKVRVYELAKELNTTSKRLMEKLSEINISVKNHMSLLEENELKALYKHIGVVKHDDKSSEDKPRANAVQKKAAVSGEVKKDAKSAPRIIRTTEIILDSEEGEKTADSGKYYAKPKADHRNNRNVSKRNELVRPESANSGLMAGFIRDSGTPTNKNIKKSLTQETDKAVIQDDNKSETRKDYGEKINNMIIEANKEENKAAQPEKAEENKSGAGITKQEQIESGKKQSQEEKPSDRAVQKEEQVSDKIKAEAENVKSQDVDKTSQAVGRPQTERTRQEGYGSRPQGDRPQGGYGSRPQGSFGNRNAGKPLEIPKAEMSDAQKEEMNSIRNEMRREFQNKDVDKGSKRDQKKDVPKAVPGKNERFKPNKLNIGQKKGVSEVLSEDFILEEFYNDDGVKKTRRVVKNRRNDRNGQQPVQHKLAVLTSITIGESITVKELAESLKKTSTDVIKKLMTLGIMATLNQDLDFDTATIIADEFGIKTEKAVVVNEEDILFDDEDDKEENLKPRPPVVVVMGHVDHGKTSLLDAIKETHVIDSEAGGITQHIGAYMVKIDDRNITFLDTPGHEAFTAMRARGAQVTDIAILVVAADDGVMPQTVEAINHAKAANVSIIVAINKIDKPGANPDKVKQELTEYGIVAEEWGGDAIMVPVSAKKRENIDQLLEMVLLTADILELKANPDRQAKGTVIEAKLDKGRGPVATVLVQRGTLKTGDSIVTGTTVGRIRAMTDDKGQSIKEAGPSTPVEILGMPEVPEAGEIFYAITDEKVAKQLAEKRKLKLREEHMRASSRVTLDDLFTQIKEGKVKDLNIIVKADVQGSVEAVKQSLVKLSNEEVRVNIVHGGVGAITESDVTLATVSNAIIIGFNVRPGTNVADLAKNNGVDLRLYRVIYSAIEDVEAAMKGMLEPTYKEVVQGHAEIRQLFKVSGIGTIAGSYVTDGKIVRNSDIRVIREGIVVHEGKLASLKRFKDDAKEVAQNFECGLSIERFNDLKEGDIVESYIMEEVKR